MRDAEEQRISRLFTVGGIVQRVGISLFGLCVATLSVTSHRCAPLNFVFCVTVAAF